MKYLALIMIVIDAIVIYKTNKTRNNSKSNKETKIILKEIISLWKIIFNFILFGIAIFLLSFALENSVNIFVNKVYNIIIIGYLMINSLSILSAYKKFQGNIENNKEI